MQLAMTGGALGPASAFSILIMGQRGTPQRLPELEKVDYTAWVGIPGWM